MSDAADPPDVNLQRDTIALFAPSAVGAQVFFVLYGLYVAQHARYATGSSYRRLSSPVRATLWLTCALTTVYAAIMCVLLLSLPSLSLQPPESMLTSSLPLLSPLVRPAHIRFNRSRRRPPDPLPQLRRHRLLDR